jgi:hypothetical protein
MALVSRAHSLVIGELRLIEPALLQSQGVGVFVELGLRRELPGGKLSRSIVGLLRQGQIGGGTIDFGFALGNDFGTRPDFDALQFSIGHGFLGFGLTQLGDQLGIVNDKEGHARCNVLSAVDLDLRQPAGYARCDVDPGAFCFTLDERRIGAREVPDRQADNGDNEHGGDDGARIEAQRRPRSDIRLWRVPVKVG